MNTETALKILRKYYKENSKVYGVDQIGIFGSVARGESNTNSDIDVVVKLKTPNLLQLVAIKQDLSEKFNQKVDIVRYRERMNKFLKKRIDQEAIYVSQRTGH